MNKYDKLMMEVALITAQESYCTKAKVGAVLAREGRIVANGYNGTVSGVDNECEYEGSCTYCDGTGIVRCGHSKFTCAKCNSTGHRLVTSPFVVHAEQNLLAFCAKEGIKTDGLTMYTTLSPCTNCAKYIVQAGIKRVVYKDTYKDDSGLDFLDRCGIELTRIEL